MEIHVLLLGDMTGADVQRELLDFCVGSLREFWEVTFLLQKNQPKIRPKNCLPNSGLENLHPRVPPHIQVQIAHRRSQPFH